jgi:hypothetical protein
MVVEPRIHGRGLLVEDRGALYPVFKFLAAVGFHSGFSALVSNAGSRIGAALY